MHMGPTGQQPLPSRTEGARVKWVSPDAVPNTGSNMMLACPVMMTRYIHCKLVVASGPGNEDIKLEFRLDSTTPNIFPPGTEFQLLGHHKRRTHQRVIAVGQFTGQVP